MTTSARLYPLLNAVTVCFIFAIEVKSYSCMSLMTNPELSLWHKSLQIKVTEIFILHINARLIFRDCLWWYLDKLENQLLLQV